MGGHRHSVIGCLEGVFAMGQVYVLMSRVTDPTNLMLVGVPPKDLLEDIAMALLAGGIDVDKYVEDACSVTGEWVCHKDASRLRDRLQVKFNKVDNGKPAEHWGGISDGSVAGVATAEESAMRDVILSGAMSPHRDAAILNNSPNCSNKETNKEDEYDINCLSQQFSHVMGMFFEFL